MNKIMLTFAGAAVLAACASAPALSPAQAAEMNTIHAACAAMGLNPSEAPFAYCVQSLAASAPPASYATNVPRATTAAAPYGGTNAGYTAENACASIGLDPSTARYSYCVSNLNQTLFDEQNFMAR